MKELIRNKQPLPATKSSDKIEESLTTQIFDLTSRLGDFFNSSLAGILDDVEADGSVQVGMFENGQLDHKQIVMRAVGVFLARRTKLMRVDRGWTVLCLRAHRWPDSVRFDAFVT